MAFDGEEVASRARRRHTLMDVLVILNKYFNMFVENKDTSQKQYCIRKLDSSRTVLGRRCFLVSLCKLRIALARGNKLRLWDIVAQISSTGVDYRS